MGLIETGRHDFLCETSEALRSKILVVDDVELNRQLIASFLQQEGYENIYFAVDGLDALEKVKIHHPDIIILDLIMPNMDGYQVCRELKCDEQYKDIPILVQTALSEAEERVKAFDAGATDLLTKPVVPIELQARVRVHLQNRFLLKDLQEYHKRIRQDLEVARNMQEALLPNPKDLQEISAQYGLQIVQQYESSDELGGDFWGMHRLDEHRVVLYITDFAGHGISAALNTFRLHSLIAQAPDMSAPDKYLKNLNKQLYKLLPIEQYATMFYGVIDTQNDVLTYSAAASTAPILGHIGSGEITTLDSTGFLLGVSPDATYEVHETPFKKDDILFLYSDAITESLDLTGKMVGDDGLSAIAKRCLARSKNAEDFFTRFFKIYDARVPKPLADDLTAVTLQRL